MASRVAVAPKGHISSRRTKSAPAGRPLRGALKIISGAQTGADRAALDVALKLKIPCGGWCPGDRRAEDGIIADCYPLTPLKGAGYRERTRQNVLDSDGTVVLSFGPLTGGSKATAGDCRRAGKPCLVIDAELATASEAAILLAVFLLRHRIHTLNVAGPRASGQPRIYGFVVEVLTHLLATPRRKIRRTKRTKPRSLEASKPRSLEASNEVRSSKYEIRNKFLRARCLSCLGFVLGISYFVLHSRLRISFFEFGKSAPAGRPLNEEMA